MTLIAEYHQALEDFSNKDLDPMYRFACALKVIRLVDELNTKPLKDEKITEEDRQLLEELLK